MRAQLPFPPGWPACAKPSDLFTTRAEGEVLYRFSLHNHENPQLVITLGAALNLPVAPARATPLELQEETACVVIPHFLCGRSSVPLWVSEQLHGGIRYEEHISTAKDKSPCAGGRICDIAGNDRGGAERGAAAGTVATRYFE